MTAWVVVADGSRARLFEWHSDRSLTEVDSLVSPEHRLHEGDLSADRPGRTFDSAGGARHAKEPSQSALDHEMAGFAKRIAERLEACRTSGAMDALVLVAPPRFMGQLRSKLTSGVLELVVHSIDKELTRCSADELAARIPRII